MVAVDCDGTVINTGYKTELIRQLEEKIEDTLLWLIC